MDVQIKQVVDRAIKHLEAQRYDNTILHEHTMDQPSSNLFEGYKSVGHITGQLPFIVRHGKNVQDTRIVTIVDRTFHTYTPNLTLVEVSIPHEYSIRMLVSDETTIYSASGRSILCWGRGSKALQVRLDNGHQANVKLISTFGPKRIVSVDDDNTLFHWNVKEREILNILSFDFNITTFCHPKAYKDKILLGFEQGNLQLWNIVEEKCLYDFKGWNSPVTCIAQSPIEDVVAIGLEDGHIHVHNIKYDETVMKIYQEYGKVTSISFRLDQQPYLITASEAGHLMVWNLKRKRLSSQIRNAHNGPIVKCQFVRNESLLVTSGLDNALKVWTMDMSDGGGTLLHQRAGHSAPPSKISFYGEKGFNLLSAGRDSTIKMFNLYSERLNRNFGTAKSNNKVLPPIICFASETAKEKQWDNIVACHESSSLVTTWDYHKCKMGERIIYQPTFDKHDVSVTSICMTVCGNFFMVGFSNGLIFKYNIQSGIFRNNYASGDVSDNRAHDGPVTGIAVDALDLVLVSSGMDCRLRMFHFKTGALLKTLELSAPIIKIVLHRENNLIAIAMEQRIELLDLETRSMIRQFEMKSKVLDMTFTPDSRWLIVAHEDCSIRTWDLTLGKLIDAFRLSSQCVSLAMSSTGEFLATAHEDNLGVNVWCNLTMYCPASLHPIDTDKEPALIDMPSVRCDEQSNEDSDDQVLVEVGTASEGKYVSPEQLHENLLSMSGLPASRWKNLLRVEEVREKQTIEARERTKPDTKVPFFIPVKDGLRPKLDEEAVAKYNEQFKRDAEDGTEMLSRIKGLQMLSPVGELLIDCDKRNDYAKFIAALKDLGPSATDAEVRMLAPEASGDNRAMLAFLNAMDTSLRRRTDYELISSWLALFLKVHSDVVQADVQVQGRCRELSDLVGNNWNKLGATFDKIICVLNFVRTSIL